MVSVSYPTHGCTGAVRSCPPPFPDVFIHSVRHGSYSSATHGVHFVVFLLEPDPVVTVATQTF